jgi:ADP-heptose:LPS heptosyltransferase
MSKAPSSEAPVLVYRLGSLGDTIIALPSFHVVRRAFPQARITVLTNLPVQAKAAPLPSILEHTGLVDDWLEYPLGLRSWSALCALRQKISQHHFQAVVHLAAARGRARSLRDYCFFRWCGIPRVIGLPWRREDIVCQADANGLGEWEARRLVRRVASLKAVDLDQSEWWDLRLTAGENQEAERWLDQAGLRGPFLAASVGTKVDVNDWTEPNWLAALARIGKRHPELGLVMLGAGFERERSDRCLAAWTSPLRLNLCGQVSPRVSAAILRQARLFLGHDSGPMHLAGCVGTRCVAIFSARNIGGQWYPAGRDHAILNHRPPCSGCQLTVCTEHQKQCMLSITVDEVTEAVERQLSL